MIFLLRDVISSPLYFPATQITHLLVTVAIKCIKIAINSALFYANRLLMNYLLSPKYIFHVEVKCYNKFPSIVYTYTYKIKPPGHRFRFAVTIAKMCAQSSRMYYEPINYRVVTQVHHTRLYRLTPDQSHLSYLSYTTVFAQRP